MADFPELIISAMCRRQADHETNGVLPPFSKAYPIHFI